MPAVISENSSLCFQFPGYLPSIDVEKTLKHPGGTKAWSMQVCEGGWKVGIVSWLTTARIALN